MLKITGKVYEPVAASFIAHRTPGTQSIGSETFYLGCKFEKHLLLQFEVAKSVSSLHPV